MTEDQPTVAYWRVWTDPDGISRQSRCLMSQFEMKAIQQGTAPQWQSPPIKDDMTVLIMVLPVGWVGDWHENPKPQWIIPLSGAWFVETMDGTRVDMGAGELSFGGDQGCRPVDGKRGHLSGAIGDVPAVLMVIQHDHRPALPPIETG